MHEPGVYWLYDSPLREQLVLDRNEGVLTVEKDWLVWNDRSSIRFDEIAFITYHYTPGSIGVGGSSGYPPSGEVSITTTYGTKMKISDDGPNRQRNLARGLAQATGKPLKKE